VPSTARWTYRFAPDGDAFREDELKPHAPVMTKAQERLYVGQRVRVRAISVGTDGHPLSCQELAGHLDLVAAINPSKYPGAAPVVRLAWDAREVWAWNVDPEEVPASDTKVREA